MNGIMTRAYSLSKNRNDYCFNSKGERCKHFKVKEFACSDGSDVVFVSPALIDVLEEIRKQCGNVAINITSGYRTVPFNKKCGGATYSQHLYGTAADIKVVGMKPKEVAAIARKIMKTYGGVGIYNNFTHVDVREVIANWSELAA